MVRRLAEGEQRDEDDWQQDDADEEGGAVTEALGDLEPDIPEHEYADAGNQQQDDPPERQGGDIEQRDVLGNGNPDDRPRLLSGFQADALEAVA